MSNLDYYNKTIKSALNEVGLDHEYIGWIANDNEEFTYMTHNIVLNEIVGYKLFGLLPIKKETILGTIESESHHLKKLYQTREHKKIPVLGLKIKLNPDCTETLEQKLRQATIKIERKLNESIEILR